MLDTSPECREFLFKSGYLVTDILFPDLNSYPFYGNWSLHQVTGFNFYIHKHEHFFEFSLDRISVVLIGHAYDPFSMEHDEMKILRSLYSKSGNQKELFDELSNLTGIFTFFVVYDDGIQFALDASGLHFSLFGFVDGHILITSHSKLVADLFNLKMSEYVNELIQYKFYRYLGNFLPGDLSPYKEMTRVIPNFWYKATNQHVIKERFFPKHVITSECDNDEYNDIVKEFSKIFSDTMQLVALKWPSRQAWVSLTGGYDSTTTLSCCNGIYDRFGYYSYSSDEYEEPDALAASIICKHLGIPHEWIRICGDLRHVELMKKIIEYNYGCIGHIKTRDALRRLYFSTLNDKCMFDVEIKSWSAEIGRAWYSKRFMKKSFPREPTPRYLTTLYKFFLNNRALVRKTDQIFRAYIAEYLDIGSCRLLDWSDLFFWEYSMSANEGLALQAEHRLSYDVTVPYNNRRLLSMMLSVPRYRRISDDLQIDVVRLMDERISAAHESVKICDTQSVEH